MWFSCLIYSIKYCFILIFSIIIVTETRSADKNRDIKNMFHAFDKEKAILKQKLEFNEFELNDLKEKLVLQK